MICGENRSVGGFAFLAFFAVQKGWVGGVRFHLCDLWAIRAGG